METEDHGELLGSVTYDAKTVGAVMAQHAGASGVMPRGNYFIVSTYLQSGAIRIDFHPPKDES